MTCDICMHAKKDNPFTVGCANSQNSTLVRHQASKDHIDSVKVTELQKEFVASVRQAEKCDTANKCSQTDGHIKQLRTVYVMAKRNIPADTFQDLMELQALNGINNCERFYKNWVVIDEMEECIFNVLKNELVDQISARPFIGIMLDETCDVTVEKKLAVYIRYLNTNSGKVKVCFDGNEHITDCTAKGVEVELMNFLHRIGIIDDEDRNIEKIVGLGTDGAAVMVGRLNGLGARLKRRIPQLVQVHCVAHRLNLAASQVGKQIPFLVEYHRHTGILYRYYADSSVKYDKLRDLQEILHGNKQQVKEPTSVRWLSVEAAVKMILQSFDAIIMCVENADSQKDPKAIAIHKFMASSEFLLVTALLVDVLCVIGILSLTFQKNEVNLSDIKHGKDNAVSTLETMRYGSHHVDSVLDDLGTPDVNKSVTVYKGVSISDSVTLREKFSNLRNKYISTLISKLEDRFPESDLDILECFDVLLNLSRYPDSCVDLYQYGVKQLDELISHYSDIIVKERCLGQFLIFKNHVKSYKGALSFSQICCGLIRDKQEVFPDFVTLAEIASIIPVSSAPCERGFSVQNSIKTSVRNRLSQTRLNRLMFIKLTGPPVKEFDFNAVVRLFQRTEKRQ